MCVGSLYTFQGYENGPVSMINHIVISKELTSNVRNALVLTEGSMNVSDHYPVLCKLSLNTVMSRTVIYSDLTKRIAWDKARQNGCLDDYTFFDRTRANLLLDLMHFFHSFRSLFLVRLETDI
jgi:hypothetical protein